MYEEKMKTYLQNLFTKPNLSQEEAESAMDTILKDASPEEIAAFLSIVKYRGEKPEEVAGFVHSLQKKALSLTLPYPVLDIVGTGGDLASTVNISTGSAILAAACGIPIAKHGNRSVSSKSGSADVLEVLGINIEMSKEEIEQCLKEVNIAFLYAPSFHPSLKKISPIRKSLKIPTVFNLLGPLLNPARAEYALIGVAHPSALELISDAALQIGTIKRGLIFHGSGLDELTPLGPIIAYEIKNGKKRRLKIDPRKLGFSPCTLKDLQGGDSVTNAYLLKEALSGKKGAIADALAFNVGAALKVFGKVSSIKKGVQIAQEVLKNGSALKLLEKWIEYSHKTRRST
jgi:anthranilate phosphoribosyltransferase